MQLDKRIFLEIRFAFHRRVFALFFLFGTLYVANAQTVRHVEPGELIQEVVNANPPGTIYHLVTGVYRLQQITPKENDIFEGEKGAILNGAELLEAWEKEGIYWTHGISLEKPGQQYDACVPGFEACKFPEDLFKDDYPMIRDTSLKDIRSGHWFLDYATRKVYMADNPSFHKMEISISRRAFGGSAANVTIRGLVIEKYAIPGHMAAIGDQYPGKSWVIEDCEVRLNHGQGISFSGAAIVRRNRIHHNGQLGLRSSKAKGAYIEHNEIYSNTLPEIGYKWSHEGGGAKFTVSDSLIIRNNYVHDNWGPGLWTDIDNRHILYEGNTCINNRASGIFHEISYDAIIRCNKLSGNGKIHGAQILISTSGNTEIYHNIITVDSNSSDAIKIVQRDRGEKYSGTNNSIHHNDITYLVNERTTGGWADFQAADFWENGNNRFDYNHYHIPSPVSLGAQKRWEWGGHKMTWKQFRASGHEAHGSLDTTIEPIDKNKTRCNR
jgi:hypothetical protein